jgi:NADH:ubiquinone oxidoreductase subunit E
MRAADAIEKITASQPDFLQPHNDAILALLSSARDKELKWHLAQIVTRLELSAKDILSVSKKLSQWALDPNESRIVRVCSMQALYDLARSNKVSHAHLLHVLRALEKDKAPSIQARVRTLLKSIT